MNELSKAARRVKHASIDYAVEAASASQRFDECARRANGLFNYWGTSTEMWKVVNESMGETVINPIGPKTLDWLEKLKLRWFTNLHSNSNNSKFQGTTQQLYAGLLGAGIIVSPLPIIPIIQPWNNKKNDGNTNSSTPGNNSSTTSSSSGDGGAPKYNIPQYALQNSNLISGGYAATYDPGEGYTGYTGEYYDKYINLSDGGIASVAEWNTTDYWVSCTYYTLRKIKAKGLGYPGAAGAYDWNGVNWVNNLDPNCGLPVSKGNSNPNWDPITDLITNQGLSLPQENIVVSFNSNHVLLIDKIYVNEAGVTVCDYSDQGGLYTNKGDLNPNLYSEPVTGQDLNTMLGLYGKEKGNINGAVILGKGN